jgi:DNA-directed RNA polymerase specialized sigma24 family protein
MTACHLPCPQALDGITSDTRPLAPIWWPTAVPWCALPKPGCMTRCWPKTWCMTCSRPWLVRPRGLCRARRAALLADRHPQAQDRGPGAPARRHDSLDLDDDDESEGITLTCPGPGPEEVAEHRQRLHRTLRRIGELPEGLRRVVELRVLHDHSTEEVCRALAITEDNLFVRLHRARRVLAS